jgi:hypothetical protein
MALAQYSGLNPYFGDLHNHCGVSYGKGTLEEAFQNARLQLDFASVTVHAHWPDIPTDDPRLEYLVDYHANGFQKAAEQWAHYQAVTDAAQHEGSFVTFPSFEWHSMAYGDYVVYFKDTAASHIIPAKDIDDMRAYLRELAKDGVETLLVPHHIGYLTGYRGINWSAFTSEFSPVVEIISFHGLSEHTEAPFPYLHSMGPRDGRSTVQYGLKQGHVFGFIGSTDHHSAHPGHYGYGRLAVWAETLARNSIWDAIRARRTVALTGDRIRLEVVLNDALMGSVIPATPDRWLEVDVSGGDAIDVVEVLHNNQIIHRWYPDLSITPTSNSQYKVCVEIGWGEDKASTEWTIDLQIEGGRLVEVEPRLRGHGIEPPPNDMQDRFVFSDVMQLSANRIHWSTVTWRNPTVSSPTTQSLCLTVEGNAHTRFLGQFNGRESAFSLGELQEGARTMYLGGFVSPAICFHRAVPQAAFEGQFAFQHRNPSAIRDWYYVRVRQQNGQYAWGSPIWVEPDR